MDPRIKTVKICLENLEAAVKCAICLETFNDPVNTKCGHNFCLKCITRAINGKASTLCPLCKTIITKRNHTRTVHLDKVVSAINSIHNAMETDLSLAWVPNKKDNETCNPTTSKVKKQPEKTLFKNTKKICDKKISKKINKKDIQSLDSEPISRNDKCTPDMLDIVDKIFISEGKDNKSALKPEGPTKSTGMNISLKTTRNKKKIAELPVGDPFLFPLSQTELKPKPVMKKGKKKLVVKNCGNKKDKIMPKNISKNKNLSKSMNENKPTAKNVPVSPQDTEIVKSIVSAQNHKLVIETLKKKENKISMSSKKKNKEVTKTKCLTDKPVDEGKKELNNSKKKGTSSKRKDDSKPNGKKSCHVHWKNSSSLQSVIPDQINTQKTPDISNSHDNTLNRVKNEATATDLAENQTKNLNKNLTVTKNDATTAILCHAQEINVCYNCTDQSKALKSEEISPAINKYILEHPRLFKRLVYSSESSSESKVECQEPKTIVSQASQLGFEDKVINWLENVEPGLSAIDNNTLNNSTESENNCEVELDDCISVSQLGELPLPQEVKPHPVKKTIVKRKKIIRRPKPLLEQNIFDVKGISQGVSPFSTPESKDTTKENCKLDKEMGVESHRNSNVKNFEVHENMEKSDQETKTTPKVAGLKLENNLTDKVLKCLNLKENSKTTDKKDVTESKENSTDKNKIIYQPELSTQPSEDTSVQVLKNITITTTIGMIHNQDLSQSTPNHPTACVSPKKFKCDNLMENREAIRLDDMPIICVAETEEPTQMSAAYFVESPDESTLPVVEENNIVTEEKIDNKVEDNKIRPSVQLGLFDFSETTPTNKPVTIEENVLFNQLNNSSEKIVETCRMVYNELSEQNNITTAADGQIFTHENIKADLIIIQTESQEEMAVNSDQEPVSVITKLKGLTSPCSDINKVNELLTRTDDLSGLSPVACNQNINNSDDEIILKETSSVDFIQNSTEIETAYNVSALKTGIKRKKGRPRKMPKIQLGSRKSKVKKKPVRKFPASKSSETAPAIKLDKNIESVVSASPKKLLDEAKIAINTNSTKVSANDATCAKTTTKSKENTLEEIVNAHANDIPQTNDDSPDMVCTTNGWGGSKLKIRIFRTSSEEEEERKKNMTSPKTKPESSKTTKSLRSKLSPVKNQSFPSCRNTRNRSNSENDDLLNYGASSMIQEYIKNQKDMLSQSGVYKRKQPITARKSILSRSAQKQAKEREKRLQELCLPSKLFTNSDTDYISSTWPKTSSSEFVPNRTLASCGLLHEAKVVLNKLDENTLSKYIGVNSQDPVKNNEIPEVISKESEIPCSPLLFQSQEQTCENILTNQIQDSFSSFKELELLVGKIEKLTQNLKNFNQVEKLNENFQIFKTSVKDFLLANSGVIEQKNEKGDDNITSIEMENESTHFQEKMTTSTDDINSEQEKQQNPEIDQFDKDDLITINSSLPDNKDPSPLRSRKFRRRSAHFPNSNNASKILKENQNIAHLQSLNSLKRTREISSDDDKSLMKKSKNEMKFINCVQISDSTTAKTASVDSQNTYQTPFSVLDNSKTLLGTEAYKKTDSPIKAKPVMDKELKENDENLPEVIQDSPTSPPPECSDEEYESTVEDILNVVQETENMENTDGKIVKSSPAKSSETVPPSFSQVSTKSLNKQNKEVDDLLKRISEFTCEMSEMNSHNISQEDISKIKVDDSEQNLNKQSSYTCSKNTKLANTIVNEIASQKCLPLDLSSTTSHKLKLNSDSSLNKTSGFSPKPNHFKNENVNTTKTQQEICDKNLKQIETKSTSNDKENLKNQHVVCKKECPTKKQLVVSRFDQQNNMEHFSGESITMSDSIASPRGTSLSNLQLDNVPIRGDRTWLGVMGSGLHGKALDIVKYFTKKFRGNFFDKFEAGKVTFLIVNSNDLKCSRTLKYLQALCSKIWVVDIHWAINSIKNRKLLPRESYEITGEIDHDFLNAPKKCRLSPKSEKLLSGFTIYCFPPFSVFTTEQIVELCQLSGAQVVDSPLLLGDINSNNKVIIFDIDAYNSSIPNYTEIAQQCGAAAVSCNWLCECIATYMVLPVSAFPVEDFDSEFSQ